MLVDEDGAVLNEFLNRGGAEIVKVSETEYKLIIASATTAQLTNYYDVYSLPGTLSLNQMNIVDRLSSIVFPNPSNNIINITSNKENGFYSELKIFDLNGKLVIEKNVIINNSKISIDISKLEKGTYIYNLDGKSNKFIKN